MISYKNISTLEEAISTLIAEMDKDILVQWKVGSHDDMVIPSHHGLGRWIRNEFGLWKGGELRKYFYEMGIKHADDMSGIILTSMWRKLHEQDIKLEEQIKHYRDFWYEQNINPDTMRPIK
jgi:hypothetical protein